MMQFSQEKLNNKPGNGLGWFALRVRANHQKKVSAVGSRGFEEFLPLYKARKWTKRSRDLETPLFPEYVFCRFERSSWIPIMQASYAIDVVRCGHRLAEIDDSEIASLRRTHRLKPGDPVKVLSVSLLQRSVLVEVERDRVV